MSDEPGWLWLVLLEIEERRAQVYEDGRPYTAGIREGLDQATSIIRDAIAASTRRV